MKHNDVPDAAIIEKARTYIAMETEPAFRDEVESLLDTNDLAELRERFSRELTFGTGGLRGVIGGGGNRMNMVAVRRTTQGLADYIIQTGAPHPAVVIAHDSRRYSDRFSREAALVLAANNIKAILFPELAPTPFLSFMVRRLKATAGIVITASHNPPQYNGYKVYWSDGAQIVGREDQGISAEIDQVTGPATRMDEDKAREQGWLAEVSREDRDAYNEAVLPLFLRRTELAERFRDYHVVYTPLHGAGLKPVTALFGRLGVSFSVVNEQASPDGDFTYAPNPNPEFPGAFELAFRLAQKTKAALVLATDPDSDRLGVAEPEGSGFRIFSGNEVGVLFLAYILETRRELKVLPEKSYIVKTIVTSELQRRLAQAYNVLCLDTLTGFKNICAVMRRMERERPEYSFLLGNEESCGYLIETDVRDKDGVSAAALAVEMGLHYRTQNLTLAQKLEALYGKYGRFRDFQISKVRPGLDGLAAIHVMMEAIRRDPAAWLPDVTLSLCRDYLSGETKDMVSGKTEKDIDLPASNVLQFVTAEGDLVTARPSGTEPKIKFYASLAVEPSIPRPEAERRLAVREKLIRERIDEFTQRSFS